MIDYLLGFLRLSIERRAVQRSVQRLKAHERRIRKHKRQMDKTAKQLALLDARVRTGLEEWRADKRAVEAAIETLENKLSVLEVVNKTLVIEHKKLTELHKADTAVHVMRQAAAAPREE